MHYQNHDVIKILEKHGSKLKVLCCTCIVSACCTIVFKCSEHLSHLLKIAPMHVNNDREVPEYEIDPNDLDFTNGNDLSKVCICLALSFL